jgi:glycosyltransferase involved in cell wall biosynthesis
LHPTLLSIFLQQTIVEIPWELIIVDNASTDDTAEFCRNMIQSNSFENKSKIVFESKQGCNHARLRGLMEVQYKWLLFCDDDNHLFPDYLEKAWKILNNNELIGVLGGQGIPLFEDQKPDWFDKYSKSFAVGPQSKTDGKIAIADKRQLYSAGSFFRKDALMKYYQNGYSTIMVGPNGKELTRGEDTEWCLMIQLVGYDLWYSSELKFYHYMSKERMTWQYFLKLKAGIAAGESKLHAYHLFLHSSAPSYLQFYFSYFKSLLFYNAIWIQFRVRSIIQKSRYSEEEKSLGRAVNSTKAKTFLQDFLNERSHFTRIKKIMKQL